MKVRPLDGHGWGETPQLQAPPTHFGLVSQSARVIHHHPLPIKIRCLLLKERLLLTLKRWDQCSNVWLRSLAWAWQQLRLDAHNGLRGHHSTQELITGGSVLACSSGCPKPPSVIPMLAPHAWRELQACVRTVPV